MSFAKILIIAATVYAKVAASAGTPTLPLAWTTYTASPVYRTAPGSEPTVWKFENVRFGVPPTGTMRFNKTRSPTAGESFPKPSGFPMCQNISSLKTPQNPPGYFGRPEVGGNPYATEDCLFLDIYVPDSVTPDSKTPVIVWFYGGAYITGSKGGGNINNPLYSGTGILDVANAAGQNAIFVAGNYRLGAFGWLGGSSYSGKGGVRNVGLYDQRLLLQWVRDNIASIGGNTSQVSAWGESAGAGSILHHLVANTDDPLFQRAFLQSPAFAWQWDQSINGSLEKVFQTFSSIAGCPGDLACLQGLPLDDARLVDANIQAAIQIYSETSQYAYGPVAGGDLIPVLPAQNLSLGNVHHLDSIAVSHVDQEILPVFVPTQITTAASLSSFVTAFMPQATMSSARSAILSNYDPKWYGGVTNLSAAAIVRDSSFTCNSRQLYDAYSRNQSVYMMYYDVFGHLPGFKKSWAVHGTDLIPTFWNQDFSAATFIWEQTKDRNISTKDRVALILAVDSTFGWPKHLARQYQKYLVSLATSQNGTPNDLLDDIDFNLVASDETWSVATTTSSVGPIFGTPTMASYVDNVFNITGKGLSSILDPQTPDRVCDFWIKIATTCIGQHNCSDLNGPLVGKGEQVVMDGSLKGDL